MGKNLLGLLVLFGVFFPAACNFEGGDPPMIPGKFPHSSMPGESSGGLACLSCHGSDAFLAMGGTTGVHHYLENDDAAPGVVTAALGGQSDTARNCLMCHVDHDIFSPGQNISSPGRAYNLRVSVAVTPSASPTTFTHTDFSASQSEGGLCLSCHRFLQTKSTVRPDGTTDTQIIDRDEFSSSVHQYQAPSTFSSDNSTFQANCLKCHSDGRPSLYQNSSFTFGLHDSLYASLLSASGTAFTPVDPPTAVSPNLLEEALCLRCHGPSTSYTTASGNDVFGVQILGSRLLNLRAVFSDPSLTNVHPVFVYADRHRPSAGNSSPSTPDDVEGQEHAECVDCHNPHRCRSGVMGATGNDLQAVLRGVWGVDPVYASGSPVPSSFSVLSACAKEYQVCLKCHSAYVQGGGAYDRLAEEFSPENNSFHPVMAQRSTAMPQGLLEPWYSLGTRRMSCSHCHGNSKTASVDPRGPHASANSHLLKLPYQTTGGRQPQGDLCFQCHDSFTYAGWGTSSSNSWTLFRDGSDNLHRSPGAHRNAGCAACHRVHGSGEPRLISIYDSISNPQSRLTSFTLESPGNYQESSCGTRGGGCH